MRRTSKDGTGVMGVVAGEFEEGREDEKQLVPEAMLAGYRWGWGGGEERRVSEKDRAGRAH